MDRRKFIRTIVAGSAGLATMGQPIERTFSAPPGQPSKVTANRRHIVRGPAHQLRDGHRFKPPPYTEFRDIVIIGAGPSSLFAAYHLHDVDMVCLEKEPRIGGNAQRGRWNGIYYTEGTAYMDSESGLAEFMLQEFGIEPTPIHSNDAYIIGNKVIPDFYHGGFEHLPFNSHIKREFHRFRDACVDIGKRLEPALEALVNKKAIVDENTRAEFTSLEAMSFEQWMRDQNYPQEVIDWCDLYCPPQVSSYPRNMSAALGLIVMQGTGSYKGNASFPGGLGVMAEALGSGVQKHGADRIRTGTFVVNVVNTADGKHVDVTYLLAGELNTIRCKTCIWGAQKHIAALVIQDMPEDQKSAISGMVYNDISVMNLCYNRTIYNDAYYTWLDGAPVNNILPANWVLNAGKGPSDKPQILTCDWSNRPEERALLLNDEWVVEQCQKTAYRLEEIFPGSVDQLVEIRLLLRAHSWVVDSPGYWTRQRPVISNDVGRVVMTKSDQSTFDSAMAAGVENATSARNWLT